MKLLERLLASARPWRSHPPEDSFPNVIANRMLAQFCDQAATLRIRRNQGVAAPVCSCIFALTTMIWKPVPAAAEAPEDALLRSILTP